MRYAQRMSVPLGTEAQIKWVDMKVQMHIYHDRQPLSYGFDTYSTRLSMGIGSYSL